MLFSCEKAIEDQTQAQTKGGQAAVTVYTRGASDGNVDVPVHVYAFDDGGTLQSSVSLQPGTQTMQLSLREGELYHIVAVAADESLYDLPTTPTLSSVITLKTGAAQGSGYVAASPLQMGFADITPVGAGATLHIQLNYQHCSLNASLGNMPESCTAASVTVAQPYAAVSMAGQMSGTQTAAIPCHKSGGTWTTDEVYLFPTAGQQTVFTVSFTDETGEHFSSATYQDIMRAGVHYIINGTYADGSLQVAGSISAPEWTQTVNLTFSFGSDTQTVVTGDGGGFDPSEAVAVTSIPAAATVWQGHVVAAVLNDDGESVETTDGLTSATLLLLSLADWSNVTSATHAETPGMAAATAAGYEEYDISDWCIPTREQAVLLTAAYGDALVAALEQASGSPIVLKSGNDNVRYLCSDAAETFRFNANGILSAGATVKYHLRLVRPIRVKCNQ